MRPSSLLTLTLSPACPIHHSTPTAPPLPFTLFFFPTPFLFIYLSPFYSHSPIPSCHSLSVYLIIYFTPLPLSSFPPLSAYCLLSLTHLFVTLLFLSVSSHPHFFLIHHLWILSLRCSVIQHVNSQLCLSVLFPLSFLLYLFLKVQNPLISFPQLTNLTLPLNSPDTFFFFTTQCSISFLPLNNRTFLTFPSHLPFFSPPQRPYEHSF